MQKINSEANLRDAILQLEEKRNIEGRIIREKFDRAIESFKPVNLIKNTLKIGGVSPDLKDTIISTSIGLAAGFLAKIVIGVIMKNPVNKLLGNAAMFGITKMVAQNPKTIKSLGRGLSKIFRGKSEVRLHSA